MKKLKNRKPFVATLLLLIVVVFSFFATKITFEEDIYKVFPMGKESAKINSIVKNATFLERIVIHIGNDSLSNKSLIPVADTFIDLVQKKMMPNLIQAVEGVADADEQEKMLTTFFDYIPFYMTQNEYDNLLALKNQEKCDALVENHLKLLISPAGMVAKKTIFRDPTGMVINQTKRLKSLQIDENIALSGSYLTTKNQKHILLFLIPKNGGDSKSNKETVFALDEIIDHIHRVFDASLSIDYFGTVPMSAANATQIESDIKLTLTIATLAIILLLYLFFRRLREFPLILFPPVLGALAALATFAVFGIKASAISFGIGAVLLGISVDYGLHFLTHFKHSRDIKKTRREVALPLIMSSVTTAAAFLCLTFLSSQVLQQLGLFAAISVLVAAASVLVFMPFFVSNRESKVENKKNNLIERIAAWQVDRIPIAQILVALLTIFLLFFVSKIGFESDISKLSYMSPKLALAEKNINDVFRLKTPVAYLLNEGNTLDEALENGKKTIPVLQKMVGENKISSFYTINELLPTFSDQKNALQKWNKNLSAENRFSITDNIRNSAVKNRFRSESYSDFSNLINDKYSQISPDSLLINFGPLLKNFIIRSNGKVYVAHLVRMESADDILFLEDELKNKPNAFVFSKRSFVNQMFSFLKRDFNLLSIISLVVVFVIILLFVGRIELAFITFLPTLISWVWILGIMGLTGMTFNIFNMIICSLIFGLGIDYSIFIMRALLHEYHYHESVFVSYKSSIILSSLTTIIGIGALIFAKHPALHSISIMAILGILSVVIVAFTIQPMLFRSLTRLNKKQRVRPVTFVDLLISVFTFTFYGLPAAILSVALPIYYFLPVSRARKQRWMRGIICNCMRFILFFGKTVKRKRVNFEKNLFKTPRLIIANHQSMLDILLMLSLSPNVVILTKDWVWKSPIFGALVRYCGYLNVNMGHETLANSIKQRLDEGCSVVIFPEGSRSRTGKTIRFQQGAFFLAKSINFPITPLVICGTHEILPPGTFIVSAGMIVIERLPDILPETISREPVLAKIARKTRASYDTHLKVLREGELSSFTHRKLLEGSFTFKDPVVENYVKIKLRFENYYRDLENYIPKSGVITDIGCGYGLTSMMLKMRSEEREIYGFDYDKKKIDTAANCILAQKGNIQFSCKDAVTASLPESDAFLIYDVLHYLDKNMQEKLLVRCMNSLKKSGVIVVRDGDSQNSKKHFWTKLSELFSTRLLGFNKTNNDLCFFDVTFLTEIAEKNGFNISIDQKQKLTSNKFYVLRAKGSQGSQGSL